MAKFCSECGAQLHDAATFCASCGAQVSASATVQQPVPKQPYQPMQPPQQTYQPIRQPAPQPRYATPNIPGAPEEKSRMGLGIGVTIGVVVGIALLIAAVIVVFVVWKPFGGSSVGSTDSVQGVAEKMAASYTDSISESDLLSVIYEYNFALDDQQKEIAKRYALSSSEGFESAKAYYGDDVKVTASVKDTETVSGSTLDYVMEELAQTSTIDRIDEVVKATIEMQVKGSGGADTINQSAYFIRVGDKWYTSIDL